MTPRAILVIVTATVVPVVLIGIYGMSLSRRTADAVVAQASDTLLAAEHALLVQQAAAVAGEIDTVLSAYEDQLAILHALAEGVMNEPPTTPDRRLRTLYPDEERAGLPAYGFVHPQYGAYANWHRLGHAGSPWIRREVVEELRRDDSLRRELTARLDQFMSLVPHQAAIYERHRDTCDLIWIVTTAGLACTYPNDYAARMAVDPAINSLDESAEDYVRLFDAEHRPDRSAAWMEPYRDAIKGRWMISRVAPLYHQDAFVGTVGIDVMLDAVTRMVQDYSCGDGGFVFLVSDSGLPLAMPAAAVADLAWEPEQAAWMRSVFLGQGDTPAAGAVSLRDHPEADKAALIADMLSNAAGLTSYHGTSGLQRVAYAQVPANGWAVALVKPDRAITAPVLAIRATFDAMIATGQRSFLFGLVVVGLAVAGLGAVWGIVSLRPIKRLIAAIDRVGRDDDWHPVSSDTDDEFSQLAASVNRMVTVIRQQECRLRVTLDSIGDAVIATDIDGRVELMNPVAERLTGRSLHEARGRSLETVFRIVNAASREPVASPAALVLASGEVVGLANHTVLLARDGQEHQIADSGAPIRNEDGVVIGVVLVFRDVTHEYALRERLQHSERMEALGQLAAGVAHDFNNVLGGIMGAAELLEERLPTAAAEQRYLAMITESAERAAGLTGQLLAFCRRQPVTEEVVVVHQVLRDTAALLGSTVDKRVTIDLALHADRDALLGDASLLQSAVLNLGLNAAQAMAEGGRLTVATATVELDAAFCADSAFAIKPGPYIEISVRDEGCGIAADDLDHVFEPFFTTRGTGGGTGLGLAAVYGMVVQHHGAIVIDSTIGVGTTVRMYLPIASREAVEASSSARLAVHGGGTILLVDDEPIVRATAKAILERFGYEVLLADDGQAGLDLFRSRGGAVDLVILDMIMPGLNGRDCLIALQEIDPAVRVLLASGYTDDSTLQELAERGIAGVIAKPFRAQALGQAVARALQRPSLPEGDA